MLIERLKNIYGFNEPIFTSEITAEFPEYSRSRVFRIIRNAVNNGELVRYDTGVYYLPTQTEFGRSVISVNQVVDKKYIENNGEVFGIYGWHVIELNFLLSDQVPNTIEVITNNTTTPYREIKIRNRRVVIRKSHCPITKENCKAYTIMELFRNIALRDYRENKLVQGEIKKYLQTEDITRQDLFALAAAFPTRTMKNLTKSGLLNEIV